MSATRDDGGHIRHTGDADGADGADAARARLPELQRSAAEAYAAIKVADDRLRVLAMHRVSAERALRLAAERHHAASRAAAAHARARPGPLAQLATRFRARSAWRQEQPALEAALAGTDRQLAAARLALSEAKDDFTDGISARAGAAATLRRLAAECAAVLSQVAAAGGGNPPLADGNSAASLGAPGGGRWDNGSRA
jgi:hypothetical protein